MTWAAIDGEAKDGIYQPPKLFPVHFTEGNPAAENEKKFARQLARARKSRLMHDLIAEYDDRPEEILDFSTWKENEKEREREVYEEENFTRLMTSKRETSKMRRKKDLDDEFEVRFKFSDCLRFYYKRCMILQI